VVSSAGLVESPGVQPNQLLEELVACKVEGQRLEVSHGPVTYSAFRRSEEEMQEGLLFVVAFIRHAPRRQAENPGSGTGPTGRRAPCSSSTARCRGCSVHAPADAEERGAVHQRLVVPELVLALMCDLMREDREDVARAAPEHVIGEVDRPSPHLGK